MANALVTVLLASRGAGLAQTVAPVVVMTDVVIGSPAGTHAGWVSAPGFDAVDLIFTITASGGGQCDILDTGEIVTTETLGSTDVPLRGRVKFPNLVERVWTDTAVLVEDAGSPTTFELSIGLTQMGQQRLAADAAFAAMIAPIPPGTPINVSVPPAAVFELISAPTVLLADLPRVGPGPLWAGGGDEGFASYNDADGILRTGFPTPPVRANPGKAPRVVLACSNHIRIGGDIVISVEATAPGGVATVDYYVEGNPHRLTDDDWGVLWDVDVNGVPFQVPGYHIILDHAACMAQGYSGGGVQAGSGNANVVNIVVIVTAKDGTMSKTQIGAPWTTATPARYTSCIHYYPAPTWESHTKTLSPTGFGDDSVATDYTDLNTALTAVNVNGWRGPAIVCTKTGFYEMGNATTVSGNSWTDGYCVIRAAPGVVATFGKATFDKTREATGASATVRRCDWRPAQNGLEWRGNGIRRDRANLLRNNYSANAKPTRLNGSMDINSDGVLGDLSLVLSKDGKYLNVQGAEYVEHVRSLNGPVPNGGQMVRHSYAKHLSGSSDLLNNVKYAYAFLVDGYNIDHAGISQGQKTTRNAMTAYYTGAETTATITVSAGSNGLVRLDWGANTMSITNLRSTTAGVIDFVHELIAAFEALGSVAAGWTLGVHADCPQGDRVLYRNISYLENVTNKNCKETTGVLRTVNAPHMDYDQFTFGPQNMIRRSNVILNGKFIQWVFWTGSVAAKDVNYICEFADNEPQTVKSQVGSIHQNIEMWFSANAGQALYLDNWSTITSNQGVGFIGCVFGDLQLGTGWASRPYVDFLGNHFAATDAGANQVGNTIGVVTVLDCHPGCRTWDFNPAGSLVVEANLTLEHLDPRVQDMKIDMIGNRFPTAVAVPKSPKLPRIVDTVWPSEYLSEAGIWTSPEATGEDVITLDWEVEGVPYSAEITLAITPLPAI